LRSAGLLDPRGIHQPLPPNDPVKTVLAHSDKLWLRAGFFDLVAFKASPLLKATHLMRISITLRAEVVHDLGT
jgi:hypothetical protein